MAADDTWVNTVAFSPDGATLAAGIGGLTRGTGIVAMLNVISGNIDRRLLHTGAVTSVLFSPDGRTLAAASSDRRIELWDTSEWLRPRPSAFEMISGDGQQGPPGTALADPLVVEVRDQHDNPLPDVGVSFTVAAGDGKLGGRFSRESAITDSSGRAGVFLTLGSEPGLNTVGVSLSGREMMTFRAEGVGTSVLVGEGDFRQWHLPDAAIFRLGRGAMGHSDRSVAFTRDGRFMAIACGIGAWVYDVATSRALALLPAEDEVNSVSFSPDGATLALAIDNGRIELWEFNTRTRIATLPGHVNWASSAVFSPDGTLLASGSEYQTIKLWDVASRVEIVTFRGHAGGVESLTFSPDGATLASGSSDDTIKLWDVNTRREIDTLEGHKRSISSVVFSPDGGILASGSRDRTVRLWDVSDRKNIATFRGHAGGVESLTFSPDGATLASGGWEGIVELWDMNAREKISTLNEHVASIQSLAFSPDGTILVSAGADGTVLLRYLETLSTVILSGFRYIGSMANSTDGSTLAFSSAGGETQLWDIATRSNIATLTGHGYAAQALALSPNATVLATSEADETIRLWDLQTQEEIATLTRVKFGADALAFSPDGASLATESNDGKIKLWDVASREEVATLEGHTSGVNSLAFSPDASMLASGSWDRTARLWDLATGKEIARFEAQPNGAHAVVFSPDGSTLAVAAGSIGGLKLWDVADPKRDRHPSSVQKWWHFISDVTRRDRSGIRGG